MLKISNYCCCVRQGGGIKINKSEFQLEILFVLGVDKFKTADILLITKFNTFET